ncbi:unnamed protein product [Mytilus edulis]|uniref:B box-type domain-containing protein n=1 Tax=Mytilus edulis TaxID=6550 RepID=A0A8S3SLX3_MYTED|nr:unnamed protein product [Mytilus edulis]
MFETCLIIATILHLAALDVMDSDHKFCTICSKRHISKPSIEWCSECNQAFCVECSECHRLMSTTENHMTVPIDSYDELRASVLSISNMCEDHNETYHLYCQSHDKLLCPTCIEDHSECKDIKSINKITKISRIPNHSMKYERLKEELSQLERKAVIDMQLTLKDLEEKKLRNARKRKQMQDITTYASDLHTFIGLKKLSSDTATYVASLQSLLENRSLDKVEIALKLDENITNFSNRINTFGSVQLQKIPGNIRLESQKNKQAQIIEERSIDDIVVKLVNTMNTKGDSIMGCEFSPGGKMVFSNFSFKLKDASDFIAVFDSDCTHLHNISVNPNYAFDVVALDEKHVAVTSPKQNESCIMLIDICSKEVTRIKTKSECRSITVSDGNFLSIAPKLGILSINAKMETF